MFRIDGDKTGNPNKGQEVGAADADVRFFGALELDREVREACKLCESLKPLRGQDPHVCLAGVEGEVEIFQVRCQRQEQSENLCRVGCAVDL